MKILLGTTLPAFLGLCAPLAAQNLTGNPATGTPAGNHAPGLSEVPSPAKAQSSPSDGNPVFTAQDSKTLEPRLAGNQEMNTMADPAILAKPSPFREIAIGRATSASAIPAEGLRQELALVSAAYREPGKRESNCLNIALAVEQRIKMDGSSLLEIVETEVTANPGCCCEVVKSAINASEASVDQVVSIVETAILASPESMRIISQCAIAAMPDSLAAVQTLLAELDPNAGESGYSSKSAKGGKDVSVASLKAPPIPNPLDLPPAGPPISPPPIIPLPVTEVNP
jgi:hypothetical protein